MIKEINGKTRRRCYYCGVFRLINEFEVSKEKFPDKKGHMDNCCKRCRKTDQILTQPFKQRAGRLTKKTKKPDGNEWAGDWMQNAEYC